LRRDGYRVVEQTSFFTAAALNSARVLVIANAMGPDGYEGHPATTDVEDDAVAAWVRRGGSLLLIADHAPFGFAAARLASRFGVTMYKACARDDKNHSGWDNERLLFSRTNRLLADHPITAGRTPEERLARVVTFTGQSLSVPAGAVAILRMGDKAYDWE